MINDDVQGRNCEKYCGNKAAEAEGGESLYQRKGATVWSEAEDHVGSQATD